MKNEEWPKVGDEVSYYSGKDAVSRDECNLETHCVIDTWESWDELKVIAFVNMHGVKTPVVQNTRTYEVSSIRNDLIRGNPVYELAEKISDACGDCATSCNTLTAKALINGKIKGLKYKP